MNSSYYNQTGTATVRVGTYQNSITIPVRHLRRKDDSLSIGMNRHELEDLRDAINAALTTPTEELVDEIIRDYEEALTDEVEKKVQEKREELEAKSEDEIRKLHKTLKGE